MPGPRRVLILGGTSEAASLARALAAAHGDALAITSSLAGRTSDPAPLPGALRIGGFGGVAGLAAYLRDARIDLLVDATHPFAAQISRHARLAAEATGTARLVLARREWEAEPGDHWIEARDLAAAAALLPRLGRSAFITTGARGLEAFASLAGVRLVVRLIAPPHTRLPLEAALVVARPPFALDAERELMQRHAVEIVVAKASGGSRAAKLDAARGLGLPVLLIARPPAEPGPSVAGVADAVRWIAARIAG